MKDLLQVAIDASIKAGKEILKVYDSSSFGVELKSDNSPLTKADTASHNVIAEYLSKTNIPILSEEDSKNHSFEERKIGNIVGSLIRLMGQRNSLSEMENLQ